MKSSLREWLRIGATLVVAAGTAAAATAVTEGCSIHNCDPSLVWLGGAPTDRPPNPNETFGPELPTQRMVDPVTWETMPIDGTYMDFRGQRSYAIFPANDGFVGPYTNILATISPDPQPSLNGSNFTLASGNLAEIQFVGDVGFTIHNDTCAQYYLRVVVTRAWPEAGAPDAGSLDLDGAIEASDTGALDAGVELGACPGNFVSDQAPS